MPRYLLLPFFFVSAAVLLGGTTVGALNIIPQAVYAAGNRSECTDGIDNEGDGMIDQQDPDCTGDNYEAWSEAVDSHEECLDYNENWRQEGDPIMMCFFPVLRENGLQRIAESCGDGIDNNHDGKADEGCIDQPPENHPPEANAGPDQTVTSGDMVTLNGAGSDPDGDSITAYRWTQGGNQPGVILSDHTSPKPTFTAPPVSTETTLYFSLVVFDSKGEKSTYADFVDIIVKPKNNVPIANAGPDQTVVSSATVTLQGSGSDSDADPITSYFWTNKATAGHSIALSNPRIANPTFSAPNVNDDTTLTFQLVVSDGKVNSQPDDVNILVKPLPNLKMLQAACRITTTTACTAIATSVGLLCGAGSGPGAIVTVPGCGMLTFALCQYGVDVKGICDFPTTYLPCGEFPPPCTPRNSPPPKQQQDPLKSTSASSGHNIRVTPSRLTTSENIIAEATGSTGTIITYANPVVSNIADVSRESINCNPPSGSMFPIGTTTVICTARGSGGLSSQGTFTVTVRDTIAPSFTSRVQDATVQAAVGQSGATVSYTTPTAYDTVDGPVAVNCNPTSGSTFPLTTTMVTCTARDSHGNTASSHDSTFTVTVIRASQ